MVNARRVSAESWWNYPTCTAPRRKNGHSLYDFNPAAANQASPAMYWEGAKAELAIYESMVPVAFPAKLESLENEKLFCEKQEL